MQNQNKGNQSEWVNRSISKPIRPLADQGWEPITEGEGRRFLEEARKEPGSHAHLIGSLSFE